MIESIFSLLNISLVLIFLTSLVEKIIKYKISLEHISAYKIIPMSFIKSFFTLTMIIHLFISISLIFNIYFEVGTILAIFIIIIYTIAIVINLIRKVKIDCGCVGLLGDHEISWKLVWRNLFIVLLIAVNYIGENYLDYSFNFYNILLLLNLYFLYLIIIQLISINKYKEHSC